MLPSKLSRSGNKLRLARRRKKQKPKNKNNYKLKKYK